MPVLKQTNSEVIYYPDHPPRVASALYVKSHADLCFTQDKPCWGCGIKHSDIVGKTSPMIAPGTAMETHHFWVEDAFSGEGVGMGGLYWPRIMSDHPTFDWKGSGFVLEDTTTWKFFIDSEFNLQVLCSACHRAAHPVPHWLAGQADPSRGGLVWPADAASMGIHHEDYPTYRDQRHCRPDTPPFRTGIAPVTVPAHVIQAADQAAVVQLALTPLAGHQIVLPPTPATS